MSLFDRPRWLGLLIALAITGPTFACGDPGRATRVSEVYPSASELPENLLRFYVYFTQPMESQGILRAIEIRDERGRAIPGVFLENRYELWSPNERRLTLILDPGRVKTGLSSHRNLGRALNAGQSYTLSIGSEALDTDGCPLVESFEMTFKAIAEDRSPPELGRWRLVLPRAGTQQALAVELDGSYDHLSLAYRLRVKDSLGEVVPGSIELADHESRWLFRPVSPWQSAHYRLAVEPSLEDLAGNRPGRPFDLASDPEIPKPDVMTPSPRLETPHEISFAPIE